MISTVRPACGALPVCGSPELAPPRCTTDWSLTGPAGRLRTWANAQLRDHGLFRLAWSNFHVVGGGMYRSGQPGPAQLRRWQARYGLRSVINLRGSHDFASYTLERTACAELGIALHDIRLFSHIPPSPQRIAELAMLFERVEYPVLMHCKMGADRSGLGSALYRILRLGHPVAEAVRELSLRYGHLRHARAGVLDYLFASYLAYAAHTPIGFMEWVHSVYDDQALKQRYRADGWASLALERMLPRE